MGATHRGEHKSRNRQLPRARPRRISSPALGFTSPLIPSRFAIKKTCETREQGSRSVLARKEEMGRGRGEKAEAERKTGRRACDECADENNERSVSTETVTRKSFCFCSFHSRTYVAFPLSSLHLPPLSLSLFELSLYFYLSFSLYF